MAKNATQNQLKELVGKTVWFRTTLNDTCSGIIDHVEGSGHAAIIMLTADGKEQHGWRHVHMNDIFLTKEDLLGANYEKFKKQVDSYCAQIRTVNELVQFCFDHKVAENGEHTDWAARSAAHKMGFEILGIDLDPESTKVNQMLENGEDVPDEYWTRGMGEDTTDADKTLEIMKQTDADPDTPSSLMMTKAILEAVYGENLEGLSEKKGE